jgi:uncharacterized membrane protein
MIQRKQTLFLIFSILIMVGYIFAPLIKVQSGTMVQYVYSDSRMLSPNINFPIIGHYFVFACVVAAGITIGLNFLTIFLYKFRKVQIAFCWLSIVPAIFCFCYVYYSMTTTDLMSDQLFYYGNISPIAAVIFIFLAMSGIRQDEELVKSVDRLR